MPKKLRLFDDGLSGNGKSWHTVPIDQGVIRLDRKALHRSGHEIGGV